MVRSSAHMPLGISDRNKMVLWPGCEGRAEFSLHTKNVWSVWFVVKRRGCCCNLSGGVALNVIHHERDVCEEQHHTYMWHEQAIIEWSWHVNSIVASCHSAKHCTHAARDFRSQHLELYKILKKDHNLLQDGYCLSKKNLTITFDTCQNAWSPGHFVVTLFPSEKQAIAKALLQQNQ